jgi:hypothetical protein
LPFVIQAWAAPKTLGQARIERQVQRKCDASGALLARLLCTLAEKRSCVLPLAIASCSTAKRGPWPKATLRDHWSHALTEQVQPHLRPIAFAATGLTLDLLYLLQKQYNMDLESILIVLCVVEASMRPFMSSPVIDHELLTVVHPPESIRGSITRLMISDKPCKNTIVKPRGSINMAGQRIRPPALDDISPLLNIWKNKGKDR